MHQAVLDVHVRRFYRTCDVGEIRHHRNEGIDFATADCRWDDRDSHVVVGDLRLDDLPAWSAAIAPHLATLPDDRSVVVDLVTWRDGERPEIDEIAALVHGLLERCSFGRALHRIDVTTRSATGPAADHLRRSTSRSTAPPTVGSRRSRSIATCTR